MASAKDISVKTARLFIDSLRESGIDVSEAYLFGSVAKGSADKDSDIDLAVVSRDFQGIRYHDIKKISKHRRKVDLRLEIHPFSRQEVEQDPPQFFLKIKQDGMRI
jgi:predicted nucleotidyltransferase